MNRATTCLLILMSRSCDVLFNSIHSIHEVPCDRRQRHATRLEREAAGPQKSLRTPLRALSANFSRLEFSHTADDPRSHTHSYGTRQLHTHADVTNSNSHTPPPPSHASITSSVCTTKHKSRSSGPTEVLKKMARNAALVVPDGMAPAMPASDTALAWGLESL